MFESPRAAFLAGARLIFPILFAAFPFGMVVGVISAEIGMNAAESIGAAMIIFAGASQLVAMDLIQKGATVWIIILSAAVVNLRHVIYSASLMSYVKSLPLSWKVFTTFFMADQVYALAVAHFEEHPTTPHKQYYIAGLAIPIATAWGSGATIGYFVGEIIPSSWPIGFVVPLMFLALLIPALKGMQYVAAALTSSAIALLGSGWPHNLGLLVAALVGIVVGTLVDTIVAEGSNT